MRNAARFLVVALVFGGCGSTDDDDGVDPVTPTPAPRVSVPAAGDHEVTLRFDGVDRRYLLHVPAGLGPEPVPVVMSLHGGGGSAPQHQRQVGLDPIADREGFVAVYPEGVGRTVLHTWNAGPYCCGPAARTDVDDVGFLAAVLDDMAARVAIDPDRVVVAGHSNGAMMASRFGAERPELVVAVVAVSAVAAPAQVPDRPVPLLQIHSVDDPRALYEGGEGPPFPGTDSTVVHFAVRDALAAWAASDGCDPTPVESDPVVAADGHTATRVEWTGCDAPVVHLRLTGAGHGWPGAVVRTAAITGAETTVVDASEELWSFAAALGAPGDR